MTPPKPGPPVAGANFFSTYSVVLDHPISKVFPILATSEGHERVTRLSSLCTGFELLQLDTVSIPQSTTLDKTSVCALPPSDDDESTDTSVRKLPRQFFTMEETVPVLYGLINKPVQISGTLTWDESAKMALYESLAGPGIVVWKLRMFSEEEENKTNVTEMIVGKCPGWLKWSVRNATSNGHKAHMDLYHTLFE